MKKTILALTITLCSLISFAQKPLATTPYRNDSFNLKRARSVVALEAGIATSASTGLYFLWYSGYEQSRFHWIDDNYGWLQIDKFGHTVTNYHLVSFCYNMNRWAGMKQNRAMLIGAGIAIGFQTAVEYFDGLSAAWGASGGDLIANFTGAGTYIAQEYLWSEQRIIWKYSFKNGDYSAYNSTVNTRADQLFGTAVYESFLKDYNGQTYWLSINPRSFSNGMDWMPKWLNVAVGYSGEGMLGANWNVWYDKAGCYNNYEHIPRYRQYYLSFDVDWERIPTKSRLLKALAPYLNIVKVPFPTLEYSSVNGFRGKAFYF
ncbi:MAG: DUF2279 domain-containing protein [Bacteroidia bacterium]